jgi:hypothetical protein
MFAVFNWKMDEKMGSAFLVFDLVGGDAGFQSSAISEVSSIQNLTDPEEAVGLMGEEED